MADSNPQTPQQLSHAKVRVLLLSLGCGGLSVGFALAQQKGWLDWVPDPMVGLLIVVPLLILIYYLWTHEGVRKRRYLIYTYPIMSLIVLIIIGALIGGGIGFIAWWTTFRQKPEAKAITDQAQVGQTNQSSSASSSQDNSATSPPPLPTPTPNVLPHADLPLSVLNEIPFKGGSPQRLDTVMSAAGYTGSTSMSVLVVRNNEANQSDIIIGTHPELNAKNSERLLTGDYMTFPGGENTARVYIRSDKDGMVDVEYRPRGAVKQDPPNATLPSDTKIGLLQCNVSEQTIDEGYRVLKNAVCIAKHQQSGQEFIGTTDKDGLANINLPHGFYVVTIKAEGYITRVEAVKVGEEHGSVVVVLQKIEKNHATVPDERIILEATPEKLTGLFKGNTAVQGAKLAEPFTGRWMKVSGNVDDVINLSKVRIRCPPSMVFAYFDEQWADRVAVLRPDEKITVFGQITRVFAGSLSLGNCEIADSNQDSTQKEGSMPNS